MNKPAHPTAYADRHIDCQFAMEEQFLKLMESARAADWSLEDAASAVIELADNLVFKARATVELEALLSHLRAARRSQ